MRVCKQEGHKLEPRYDISLPGPACMPDEEITDITPELMESLKGKIYVKDICVVCGYSVSRSPFDDCWR